MPDLVRAGCDRPSNLDRFFLVYEGPASHMHIAGTATFEGGPLRRADGAVDIDRIRALVQSRLPRIPRYRQVLSSTPLGRPIWLDDPHFDVEYHVRLTSLPRPGDVDQLKALCGRLFSQALDRARPLWEVWIVDGVAGGERVGFVTKIHHAIVDGVRSIDLLESLLDPEPLTSFEAAPPWTPRPRPGAGALVRDDIARAVHTPLDLAHLAPALTDGDHPASDLLHVVRGLGEFTWKALRAPSHTPFNKPIGPHRRFDWTSTNLDDVQAVRRAFGGTINDVVLATVSGAVRRFLEHRGESADGVDFRVMAPVSVAPRTNRADALGNQVSAWMVPLPLAERDPRRALEAIQQTTRHLKEEKSALGILLYNHVAGLAPAALLSLAARLAYSRMPYNMVVTNVPGPRHPVYLLGAKMLEYHGTVPLTDYLGLGTVIVSYEGKLSWGFNADRDLVPDVDVFARAIDTSFRELRDAAR